MKKVQVLYFEGCPNHPPAVQLARETVTELGISAEVSEVEVTSEGQARNLRFLGSPTILVDGVDIDPSARGREDYSFSCRMYGASGIPAKDMMKAALSGNSGLKSNPGIWTALGAVSAAAVASACCWLPIMLIAAGVSSAGVSAAIEPLRPYFLGVTVVLLSGAFYVVYFRKRSCAPGAKCETMRIKPSALNQVMLWLATAFVAGFALFPYYGGYIGTRNEVPVSIPGRTETITVSINGMTCEACAAQAEKSLAKVTGVHEAAVEFDKGQAVIAFSPKSIPSNQEIQRAIEEAGFTVNFQSAR